MAQTTARYSRFRREFKSFSPDRMFRKHEGRWEKQKEMRIKG